MIVLMNWKSFNNPISNTEAASIEIGNYFKVTLKK